MRPLRPIAALLLVILAVFAAGCIQEDNTITLYLDPNGQVTWSILERNVRSDSKDRGDRQTEESQFIVAAPQLQRTRGVGRDDRAGPRAARAFVQPGSPVSRRRGRGCRRTRIAPRDSGGEPRPTK